MSERKPQSRAVKVLHSTPLKVRLADTDAAGRLYFAAWLQKAHEVFEEWMDRCGLPLSRLVKMPVIIPVVECRAEYRLPVLLGDALECSLTLHELREKSFTVEITARRESATVATAQITHVAVQRQTGSPCTLPEIIVKKLQNPSSSDS